LIALSVSGAVGLNFAQETLVLAVKVKLLNQVSALSSNGLNNNIDQLLEEFD
jgi:hypothetical protein